MCLNPVRECKNLRVDWEVGWASFSDCWDIFERQLFFKKKCGSGIVGFVDFYFILIQWLRWDRYRGLGDGVSRKRWWWETTRQKKWGDEGIGYAGNEETMISELLWSPTTATVSRCSSKRYPSVTTEVWRRDSTPDTRPTIPPLGKRRDWKGRWKNWLKVTQKSYSPFVRIRKNVWSSRGGSEGLRRNTFGLSDDGMYCSRCLKRSGNDTLVVRDFDQSKKKVWWAEQEPGSKLDALIVCWWSLESWSQR